MDKPGRIKLVSVECDIFSIGFRRIAAVAKHVDPSVEICLVKTGYLFSETSHFFSNQNIYLKDQDIVQISKYLSDAEMIGFSSLSMFAESVEKIIKCVKTINPDIFIIWGGVHPTLYPDEALHFADAVCIGEGEIPIKGLIETFKKDKSPYNIPNTWFNVSGNVVKNKSVPLNDTGTLNELPHLFNLNESIIYDYTINSFTRFNEFYYKKYSGSTFLLLWTLGCPNKCSYCSNYLFINRDAGCSILRYPSVDYILDEIKTAKSNYPYIKNILFFDDILISLPFSVIEQFSIRYKSEINMPFGILGLHPNFVNKEKIELLASAGMNLVRMGIQSGSENTLKFYNRSTKITKITESASVIADAARKYRMRYPIYDIITDNPVESQEDIAKTLKLLYDLKRPYKLIVYSLRVYPKTQLYELFSGMPGLNEQIFRGETYLDTRKTINNIALYLFSIFKPPKLIFKLIIFLLMQKKWNKKEYRLLHKFLSKKHHKNLENAL